MFDDPLVAEYVSEIGRINREIRRIEGCKKRASRPKTVKRLNRALYTLWIGRGQLRRTVRYMLSHERLVVPSTARANRDQPIEGTVEGGGWAADD